MTTPIQMPTIAQLPMTQMPVQFTQAPLQFTQAPYYQPIPSATNSSSVLNMVEIVKGIVILCVVGVVLYGLYMFFMMMQQLAGGILNIAKDVAKPVTDAAREVAGSDVGTMLRKQPARLLRPLTQTLNLNTYTTEKGIKKFAGNLGNALTFGIGGKVVGLF